MPTISTLTIDVQTRTSNFSRGIRTMTVGLAALAGGAIYAFKQFEDAENVTQQTAAVLKSTGGAAKVTAGQVADLADAISKKTGIDDEAIQSGENLLLTFTKIRNETGKGNDIFNQATSIITDMSAALDQDLKSSAIQVGKALQDPILGLTALRRVGVNFNEQQSEMVKKMVESGHQLQAQKFILQELNTEFAGSAVAQKTASGTMRVAFENLAETIGGLLAPIIEKLVGWLTQLADWFTSLPKGMQEFLVASAAVAAVLVIVAKAFGVVSTALKILNLQLLLNPYVLIAAATIAIAILIVKNWDTIKDFLSKVWSAIVDAAKFFWDHIAIFIIGPMKLVIDFLIDHWRGFRAVFLAIWDAIRDAIGPIVGAIVNTIRGIIDVLMDVINAIKATIGWFRSLAETSAGGGINAPISPGGGRTGGLRVPAAQHGGFVTATGLAQIHAGETIVPAGGGGGLTLIINGDVTGEEIVRKVRDGLLRLQARNATTGL